jgi:hypothetical protein
MPEGIRSDQVRDRFLHTQGFMILRFWNSDIDQNLDGVMESVLASLDSSASTLCQVDQSDPSRCGSPPPDQPSAGHPDSSSARIYPTRGRDKKELRQSLNSICDHPCRTRGRGAEPTYGRMRFP